MTHIDATLFVTEIPAGGPRPQPAVDLRSSRPILPGPARRRPQLRRPARRSHFQPGLPVKTGKTNRIPNGCAAWHSLDRPCGIDGRHRGGGGQRAGGARGSTVDRWRR